MEKTGDTAGQGWSHARLIAAGTVGNVLEWYDFAVYGFFASILAEQFFPSDDPTVSLIAAFGAFAAGFLMRPVGAALFGHIGDKYGRARALVLSVLLMAVPTFLIGLLPTYETLGVLASILVVILRMAQGLAVGGEYTSSVVYLAEAAPVGKRAFYSSWALFGGVAGTMLGSAVGALLTSLIPDADLRDWGWRIGFYLGIAAAGVAYFFRRGMHDEGEVVHENSPLRTALTRHWKPILRVTGLNVVAAVGFYTFFVYIVTWLTTNVGIERSTALDINTATMLLLLVLIPLCAWLSDRLGRRRILVLGIAGFALNVHPLVVLMHHDDVLLIGLGQAGIAIFAAMFLSCIPAAATEMFPRAVRATAVGLGYNLTFAIFGGTAPMVAVWLIERQHDDLAFTGYAIAAALVSLGVALTVPDLHDAPLPD
jgi:MHS family proline/betaine transporter-like MFS transporter